MKLSDNIIIYSLLRNIYVYVRLTYLHVIAVDYARSDAARLLVPIEYLGHAAVRYFELSGYVAGPHAGRGHFDDLQPDHIRQRPAVDERATQLVHTPLAYK